MQSSARDEYADALDEWNRALSRQSGEQDGAEQGVWHGGRIGPAGLDERGIEVASDAGINGFRHHHRVVDAGARFLIAVFVEVTCQSQSSTGRASRRNTGKSVVGGLAGTW